MQSGVRIRLCLMMFVEYAVWGAWMPVISATLINRGLSPLQVATVFTMQWLGLVISPFLGGQLVDRRMASQHFLAICHAGAAVAAFIMAEQKSFAALTGWMLVWALFFAPTLGVTNSIALRHIDRLSPAEAERERTFSWIRTCGTIGWIVAAFALMGFMSMTQAGPKEITGPILEMQLAGMFGILMVLVSFALPDTPPARDHRVDPLAWRKALGLFKSVPGFTVFMVISFFAATEFQFFYNLSGPFLEAHVHVTHAWIAVTKSISQVSEVAALGILLPLWLPTRGMRWCLLVGSFAWPLRYFIFAYGHPGWLVVLSLGLHGFGYAFVLVVQQLYVDRVSPADIRGSAQNLLNFVTLGVGNVLGSIISGVVQQAFTNPATHQTNWVPVFVLPAATTLICALAYMFTFRDSDVAIVAAQRQQAELAGA